ncbi:hemolysin family protein [Bacillus paralicheniformis]|uniref:hemolysin family protein n=3 Tax=Bacillus paralicheniformis TaxID=1648923 RepID=UPI000504EA0A|nr:hemolysin family protein [Bacillus paralicheniformis]KFM89308.1 transporter associated domain protein [Bacillus paralicheniformis]MDR4214187.1 HlyC/CorC family transporter [Bacillus paralicheniformis]MDU0412798.1 hemolysin family protein [Bacillus paralicheniformis]MEC2170549.1 hemolysin family protein [Bacillus paralicheniformis]RZV64086.1 HlyC/CorC family transporter [Bacillus paralicheniformis]
MDDIVSLIIIGILIALTAFFVASEFAIVRVRSSRIDQLIAEGNKKAVRAKQVVSDLDEYLSACQLGITITALGLGWMGEPTVKKVLHPVFESLHVSGAVSHALSVAIAFLVITFLNVVVGELAPKTIAIQKAEQMTLWLAGPLHFFNVVMFPFIWTLNASARVLTGLFGLKPASEKDESHSEEELRILLSESYKSGEINPSEYRYVNKIFEFDNRIAKEIMVPRTEIASVPVDMPIDEAISVMLQEKYTRWPVYKGDKDHVIGMINTKQLFTDMLMMSEAEKKRLSLEAYVRPVIEVIETVPVQKLLIKMQRERIHMAILTDEYGGTSGLVTAEDILEEIVGEIRDEFDEDEKPLIEKVSDHEYIMDGKVRIDQVNELFEDDLEEEEVETVGGLVLKENIDIAEGQAVHSGSYTITVLEMEGRLIKHVEVKREQTTEHVELAPANPVVVNEVTLSEK